MPSVTMKDASICCAREKNCLRVCNKSNTISKRSQLKISQLATEDDTNSQSCQEVSSSSESKLQDRGTSAATNFDEFLSGEDFQFKQQPSLCDESAVIEVMELPSASSSSKSETIFSPTLDRDDGHAASNSYNGVYVLSDPFLLSSVDESDDNSGSSSDYQTCNILDFCVSDMIFEGSALDGSFLCDDMADTLILPEPATTESNILFDVTERHLTLPILDDSVETSETLDSPSLEEGKTNCRDSGFLLAIHQCRPGDQEIYVGPCVESDEAEDFDPHSFIRNLPDLSDVPSERLDILPKESWERKPITLVLDLDETLVHSTLDHCENSDFTFTVFFNMKEHIVYVKERPHLRAFLKKVAEMFEIVVFTASQSIYAEQLLDILDPDRKLISGRAYRESCIFSDGSYTKDLTVLGLDLAKVVIVDNSPQVFRLQVNNGIPIKSWFDDPSDNELISLIPFLETLAYADDVRPLIAKRFGNKE